MPKMKNNLNRRFYAMATFDDDSAEITLYGDVVERQPTDWWTGEPIEGDFIVQSEFISDLNDIIGSGVKKLTFRINSFGGDASVGLVIHNRLRELAESGVEITCKVDGVAMSAGSVIMCAADNIIVHPSSLIMIHKCWSIIWGGYNADELRAMARSCDAWDNAMIEIYAKKTGLSNTVLSHMMSDTTYMTGREAVEKGFANELTEDEGVDIAASADRHSLFVSGRRVALARGIVAPESIPTVEPSGETVSAASADDINQNPPGDTGNIGGSLMATNLTELRKENPELAGVVENEVRAAVSAENATAVADATTAERARIQAIDEIAGLYDAETVREAKYGEHACSAQDMAFRAAQKAAKQGGAFQAAALADNAASGANGVNATCAPEDKGKAKTKEERMAEAETLVAAVLGKKED